MEKVTYRLLATPHAALIQVDGQLQGPVSYELQEVVRHLGHRGAEWMIFDLRHIVTMDSLSLGVLLLARSLCAHRRGRAALLGPSPALMALLDALRIRDQFMIVDDTHAIVAMLRRSGAPAEAGN